VDSVLPMIEPQIAAKGLHHVIDVPPHVLVAADSEKLQQILLNLLSNAVKFTPPGGNIAVTTGERPERPHELFLRVADAGIGIPDRRLDSIFEPFVQVENESRGSEGTGLGLTISRNFARGMGGDLRVRSVLGEGSVFTITLPKGTLPAE
jgi:signal transduction histidine kinase